MARFSKYIRPGAKRIGFNTTHGSLLVTAAKNPDGTIAVVLLNMDTDPKNVELSMEGRSKQLKISPKAIQTLLVKQLN